MKQIIAQFLILYFLLAGAAKGEDFPQAERPKLAWETLKGYRLFFHPDDLEESRRSLSLEVPKSNQVRAAWALIRPWSAKGSEPAWLRIEGQRQGGYILFDWDGTYENRVFEDQLYEADIYLHLEGEELQHWRVPVFKSLLHPQIVRLGQQAIFRAGVGFGKQQAPGAQAKVSISRREGKAPILAEVYLPNLDSEFSISGVMVSARLLEDRQGFERGSEGWDCFCFQEIPANSPARRKQKKVQCVWDLSQTEPGLYELRVSLWHRLAHYRQDEVCSFPLLDSDSIQVNVLP